MPDSSIAGGGFTAAPGLEAALASLRPVDSSEQLQEWGECSGVVPSGHSTPGSEQGGGRVRRPLLYDLTLRSSDKAPPPAPLSGSSQQQQQQQGSRQLSPLPPRTGGAAVQHQLMAAADGDESEPQCMSLSLGGDGGLAQLVSGGSDVSHSVSCSFSGGGLTLAAQRAQQQQAGEDEGEGDTATSATPVAIAGSGHGSAAALLPLGAASSGEAQVASGSSAGSLDGATLPVRPRHTPSSSVDAAAALGLAPVPPPNLEQIYAAIASKAVAQQDSVRSGQPPAGAGGEGLGEGIASCWWTTNRLGEWVGVCGGCECMLLM